MIFLLGIFTWIALRKAYHNDQAILAGGIPYEKTESDEKLFTWPDLVYTEMLCMIVLTIVMIVWSVGLRAPLEEAANPTSSPNPAKAPWYFLGLQEMLVYFDPWLAGVVFPSLIIVGLMAIPYIDTNPKGNGYFTFKERRVEITLFLFGFLILWVLLVTLGTFLRGPNWNFFGPYEYWDLHKLLALNNVNLSEYFWVKMLHVKMPSGPLGMWIRELPGILLTLFYIGVLPGILAMTRKTWSFKLGSRTYHMTFGLRKYFEKLGPWRYSIFVMLLLCMIALPIKMVLRWTLNLKYIVAMPEIFFNI
jgi:hypothetical protein